MPVTFNEEKLYTEIGKRIRSFRKKKRLTQAELAELAKLKRTSITHIENGNQNSPLHVVMAICNALEIEISDLIPRVDEFFGPKINRVEIINVGTESKYVSESIATVLKKLEIDLNQRS